MYFCMCKNLASFSFVFNVNVWKKFDCEESVCMRQANNICAPCARRVLDACSRKASPRRFILLFGVPCIVSLLVWVPELHDVFLFTPCLLIMALICVANFPEVAPSLHKKPIYLSDIKIDETEVISSAAVATRKSKQQFYGYFYVMVNFSFALLITGFFDYAYIIITRKEQAASYIEIMGIIGGVLSLWGRAQQVAGRVLLFLCYALQRWRESNQRLSALSLLSIVTTSPLPNEHDRAAAQNDVDEFLGV